MLIDYGVGKAHFEGHEGEVPCVQFGDGKTGIFTAEWDNQNVGIMFGRVKRPISGREHFNEETPPPEIEGDVIYLLFDTREAIDTLISQLNHVKASLDT